MEATTVLKKQNFIISQANKLNGFDYQVKPGERWDSCNSTSAWTVPLQGRYHNTMSGVMFLA